MLPFLTERFGNPSGSHAVARERAQGARRGAATSSPRASAPSRARSCSPAAAPRPTTWPSLGVHGRRGGRVVCTAVEHHAVLHAAAALGGDVVAGRTPTASSTSTRCGRRSTARRVGRLGDAGQQRGGHGPAARRGRRRGARPRAPSAVLHTDAVQAFPWLDVAALARARRPGRRQRPQVRRPQGRRRARGARRRPARRRSCTAAGRSATGAAAPTTSPASSGWPRPCGATVADARDDRGAGRARCATAWPTACSRRSRTRSRPATATRKVAGNVPSRVRGRRVRGAARPARRARACARRPARRAPAAPSSRRTCWLAMGVGERRALGALRLSLGCTDHRRRRRPAPRGRPRGGRPAPRAALSRCACSSPCPAASTRRSPPPCCSSRATRSWASP